MKTVITGSELEATGGLRGSMNMMKIAPARTDFSKTSDRQKCNFESDIVCQLGGVKSKQITIIGNNCNNVISL